MRALRITFSLIAVLALRPALAHPESVWEAVQDGSGYTVDLEALKTSLEGVASEFDNPAKHPPVVVAMPMPDGTLARFAVYESPVMEPELAAKYPEIKTYGGRGVDDATAVIRFDIGPRGLHGIVLSGGQAVLIRPHEGNAYRGLRGSEVFAAETFSCSSEAKGEDGAAPLQSRTANPPTVSRGGKILIYRLAVGATGEYTASQGGTKNLALAAITSTINQANAIFQSEAGIFLDLVANEDQVIYTDPATDPYTSGDLSCTSPIPACVSPLAPLDCLRTENQCTLDAVIGSANYDVGIVLDGANIGGVAAIGSVCGSIKGRAAADGNRFQVVVHEIAHEFGALHTFNDNMNNACGNAGQWDGNGNVSPGSGSTLMSYAGDCGAANLQRTRDSYFHSANFIQMYDFTETGGGVACRDLGFSQNFPPIIRSVTSPATIPSRTPFVLETDAYDPNGPVTIAWEQVDANGTASPPEGDDGSRPIFRAYPPTSDGRRFFPSLKYVYSNANTPPATYTEPGDGERCPSSTCLTGEYLPTTTRTLNFRVIVRDGDDGVTSATTSVTTRADAGPFRVLSPNSNTGSCWANGTTRTVTWDVANTNNAPVSTATVNILLSVNNGITYPYTLAANTPNDGNEVVTVPDVLTDFARVKIEAVGNIYYDVSDDPFRIGYAVVSNTNDSGCGSLRQAIQDYNALGALGGGVWEVPFSLPNVLNTIHLSSRLPSISVGMLIDAQSIGGQTYAGPPLLELDGTGVPAAGVGEEPANGLTIGGNNTGVYGLVVRGFEGDGIRIAGASDVVIASSYIGTDAAGNVAAGNGAAGVFVSAAANCRIQNNLISGNGSNGVFLSGLSASGNRISGNKIGTDVSGTQRVPNSSDGIRVLDAPGNTIGGIGTGEGNVISGNGKYSGTSVITQADGIEISGAAASGNVIQQNRVGLNAAGDAALDNTAVGIRIVGAPNTLIGGTDPLARNWIADRGVLNFGFASGIDVSGAATGTVIQGNFIGTDVAGNIDLGPRGHGIKIDGTPGVLIGGTTSSARNLISGANSAAGVYVLNGGSATIQGNYIGTNAAGTAAIGNYGYGIQINSAGNVVGGTVPGAGNLISGNGTGIYLQETVANNNTIQGNLIGTDVTGTQDLGNASYGISILRGVNNVIGGSTTAARNVISGNNVVGIVIQGSSGSSAPGHVIRGNYVGTNAAGTAAVANGTGVRLQDVTDIAIGGGGAGEGNVISGNQGVGLDIFNSTSVPATGVVVQGNRIGTNAAGTVKLGNFTQGIASTNAGTITVGGSGNSGNLISGNGQNGISLCCGVGNAILRGNKIGTDFSGTLDLSNGYSGIFIGSGNSHTIGGAGAGEGNVIAFNSTPGSGTNFAGVKVTAGIGTSVRGNSLFSNVGLGIDLGGLGITANDVCDADSGANGLQNFPVLSAATQSGPATRVEGTLNSTASTSFTLDFYASPTCDSLGNGEGQNYLGSTTVNTDGSCNGAFASNLPVPSSGVVTATATAPDGSTSEFSTCRAVAPSPVAEVPSVVWASKSELTWSAASGATAYRVLRGILADLPRLLTVLDDSCERFSGAATTTGPVLTEDPVGATGRLYWYLVVGSNGTFEGPAGQATAGPRVANAAGSCP